MFIKMIRNLVGLLLCGLLFTFLYSTLYIQESMDTNIVKELFNGKLKGVVETNQQLTTITSPDLYKERNLQIESVCLKYGLGSGTLREEPANIYQQMEKNAWVSPEMTLMHLPQWSLLYCWIHKAASTSWSKVFFDIVKNKVMYKNLHKATRLYRPKNHQVPRIFKESVSFTFVRHPFERLVSAYRDKFELGAKNDVMYKMYVADILDLPEKRMNKTDKYGKTDKYQRTIYGKVVNLARPTFQQFVSYLLLTRVEDYNPHWIPYWLQCHVCGQKFDVVGKLETIKEDTIYIQELTGRLSGQSFHFPMANSKNTVYNVSLGYFKDIESWEKKKLFEVYRIDFEMFGYDVEGYFKL